MHKHLTQQSLPVEWRLCSKAITPQARAEEEPFPGIAEAVIKVRLKGFIATQSYASSPRDAKPSETVTGLPIPALLFYSSSCFKSLDMCVVCLQAKECKCMQMFSDPFGIFVALARIVESRDQSLNRGAICKKHDKHQTSNKMQQDATRESPKLMQRDSNVTHGSHSSRRSEFQSRQAQPVHPRAADVT